MHKHGAGTGDTSREAHCPDAFKKRGGHRYNLDLQRGPMPPNFKNAIDRDYHLNNLATAYSLIATSMTFSATVSREDWYARTTWFPEWADVTFALNALRACGYRDEATDFVARLLHFRGRHFISLGRDGGWCGVGPDIRRDLLATLKDAWQGAGR